MSVTLPPSATVYGPPAETVGARERDAGHLRVVVGDLVDELRVDVDGVVVVRPREQAAATRMWSSACELPSKTYDVPLVHAAACRSGRAGRRALEDRAPCRRTGSRSGRRARRPSRSGRRRGCSTTKSCDHRAPAGGAAPPSSLHRRLEAAQQRVVAALRVEVVRDHEHRAGRGRRTRRRAACGSSPRRRSSGRCGPGCTTACVAGAGADDGVRVGRAAAPAGRRTRGRGSVRNRKTDADVAARLRRRPGRSTGSIARERVRRARRRAGSPRSSVVERLVRRRRRRCRSRRCCPGPPRAPRCPASAGCCTIRSASPSNFAGGSLGREVLDVERRDRELGRPCGRRHLAREAAVDARSAAASTSSMKLPKL